MDITGMKGLKQVVSKATSEASEGGTEITSAEMRQIATAFDKVMFLKKPEAAAFLRDNVPGDVWDTLRRDYFAAR